MSSSINVTSRLRPIRFAFLVRPDDGATLQQIFQINSCLWGGQFNPIVPYFSRVPIWWDRKGIRFDNAKQIINGYLDFFEPDFLVEAEKGLSKEITFDPERVLQLNQILAREGERHPENYGQSVFDLYRKLYREEFQFVRRHPHRIKLVLPKDKVFANFSACVFGAFPTQKPLGYFAKGFRDAFDPEQVKLDGNALSSLYKSDYSSALKVGCAELDIGYHSREDPVLFVLDAKKPKDLIDFWNYRAIHPNVVAIPVQWLTELSDFCKGFITRNFRPLPGNSNGVMIRPISMFSRSIPEADIEPLHKAHLQVAKSGANAIQTWYPPIWRPAPDYMARSGRPDLTYKTSDESVPIDIEKPELRFSAPHPDFAEKYAGKYRWAQVISLQDWSFKSRLATVYPTDFRKRTPGRFHFGGDLVLSTTEGLVLFPRYKDLPVSWTLEEGATAHGHWLKEQGITIRISESGRATQQIIHTLGNFWGVRSLAYKGVLELLDGMARRPVSRSAHFKEFRQKVQDAVSSQHRHEKVFETLVEQKAVELGQELKCSKCGGWGWYSLSQLNSTITCGLCLRDFTFPICDPGNGKLAKWAYRVIGPFALPDFARGGYAAALTIRFFSDVTAGADRAETTWSAGHELTLASGKKVEADCILWYQRKRSFGQHHPTEIIFAETKSFGKKAGVKEDLFTDTDVERMKLLAEQFPGCILAFSTLRQGNELTKAEVQRLRKLAQWGREYNKDARKSRAPVVLLTGLELFTEHYVESTWKEKGGKHKQLVEPGYVSLGNLRRLADFTQQLYLGMQSYHDWRDGVWKKRHALREKRAANVK